MGSVQPFPGKQAGTLADVWRLASLGAEPPRVRNTRREDYAAIRAVQRDSSPHVPPWSLRQLEAQVHAFPQGQLVAIADGDVAGASAALVVTWNEHEMGHTWRSITADGTFATHQGAGDTLYCAAMVTDPSRRGFGVARTLAQAQRRLCRRLNLRRIITTARLAGYAPHASEMAVEDYARRVVWGEIEDAGLRFALAHGYQFCGVLPGYLPEDAESQGNAALLAWLNPLHAPPQPPASIVSERRRRAA
jgi:GNAT superfamily N-acetyltransferase